MKKIVIIIAVMLVSAAITAKTQTISFSSVINETVTFLLNKANPAGAIRNVTVDFAVFEDAFGIGVVSGSFQGLNVDSVTITVGTQKIKKYFLQASLSNWQHTGLSATGKTASFTSSKSAVLTAPTVLLELKSSRGISTLSLPSTMTVTKTKNSYSMGGMAANEYIISGFVDPSNPVKYVSIRIKQAFVHIGG